MRCDRLEQINTDYISVSSNWLLIQERIHWLSAFTTNNYNRKHSCRRDSMRCLPWTTCCQKLDFLGYIFVADNLQWIWRSYSSESCRFVWNNTWWRPLCRSRSLKVTSLILIPIESPCDFLLANTTNLSCLAPFPSYRGVLVKLTGVPLFNSFVGVNLWTLDCEIWPQKCRTSLYCVAHNIFRYIEPVSR